MKKTCGLTRNDFTTLVGRGIVVPDPSPALMGSPVIEMQPSLEQRRDTANDQK